MAIYGRSWSRNYGQFRLRNTGIKHAFSPKNLNQITEAVVFKIRPPSPNVHNFGLELWKQELKCSSQFFWTERKEKELIKKNFISHTTMETTFIRQIVDQKQNCWKLHIRYMIRYIITSYIQYLQYKNTKLG